MVRSKARIAKYGSLQKKLFKHALDQEVAYSDVVGEFSLRSYADADVMLESATSIVPDFFAASIKLFTTLYMMMFINVSLSFLSLLVLLLTNLVILKPLATKGARLQIINIKVHFKLLPWPPKTDGSNYQFPNSERYQLSHFN